MKKVFVLAAALILALLIGYIAVGPLITIHNIKSAIENKDSEKLSDYVDFPSLRTNLKEQLNSELLHHLSTELKDNPFMALGLALGPKLVDGIVDSLVTPTNVSKLLTGKLAGDQKDDMTQQPNQEKKWELLNKARYTYDSSSKFSVWVEDKHGKKIRCVLTRDGFFWKLSNIIFDGLLERSKDLIPIGDAPAAMTTSPTETDPAGVLRLRFKNVSGKFHVSNVSGVLFCIQGTISNMYQEPRSFIQLKASLLDNTGKAVCEKKGFAGNSFSDSELRDMSLDQINQRLGNPAGDGNSNVNIEPNTSIPFMIVFGDLPEDLGEFTVEPVSSKPGGK